MWCIGYWMERGFSPETLAKLSRSEMIMYEAIAKMNQDEQKIILKNAVMEAIIEIMKAVKR